MEITTKFRDSNLNNLTLYESIDLNALNLLISSNLLKDTFRSPFIKFANEQTQLKAYKELINEETHEATVLYTRKLNIGRVNPNRSLGLHTIRREIRHTLARKFYFDVDIKNAHPVLLSQICQHNDIKAPKLSEYIDKRMYILEDTMNRYKVSKDQAKNLFIRLLYFGEFKFWAIDNKLIDVEPTPFIKKFEKEIQIIGDKIIKANRELKKEIEDAKNEDINEFKEKGTIVSYFLQEKECQILEVVYNYCKNNNIIINNAVLCNDGLMIPKANFNNELLEIFKNEVYDKLKFNIDFEVKEMGQGYTDEQLRENQKFNTENITQYYIANFYYSINPYKYIFSSKLGWYEYNNNNILICHGSSEPPSLIYDMSDKLTKILKKDLKEVQDLYFKIPKEETPENKKIKKDTENNIKQINNALLYVGKYSNISGCIKFLVKLYTIKDIEEKIDANINLLAFNNCLFDYKLKKFRNIEPQDYISKTTNYDITPNRDKQQSEKIYNLINTIFSSEEVKNYWLKTTSIALFNNSLESLYIQTGSGSNGKGLLSTIISKTLGSYFYTCENTFFTSTSKAGTANSSLINTKGARIVSVCEPDTGEDTTYFNIDFIKTLTGRDPITCRDLFKSNITFTPQFTPFLQCNKKPAIKKIDNGSKRRIKIVNFPFEFTDEPIMKHQKQIDRELKENITQPFINEFMHILIETAIDCKDQKINVPEEVQEEINEYFNENDPVKPWFMAWIQESKNEKIKTSDLYKHFISHSDQNISNVKFMDYLKAYNLTIKTISGYKYIYNIKLIDDEINNDEPF